MSLFISVQTPNNGLAEENWSGVFYDKITEIYILCTFRTLNVVCFFGRNSWRIRSVKNSTMICKILTVEVKKPLSIPNFGDNKIIGFEKTTSVI